MAYPLLATSSCLKIPLNFSLSCGVMAQEVEAGAAAATGAGEAAGLESTAPTLTARGLLVFPESGVKTGLGSRMRFGSGTDSFTSLIMLSGILVGISFPLRLMSTR